MVCAVEEIEKSTLFWGEGGKCDQDAQKFNFLTKCLNTFVAHCSLTLLCLLCLCLFAFLPNSNPTSFPCSLWITFLVVDETGEAKKSDSGNELRPHSIFSNCWMRLSRIWRIPQIKEGVIHRGRRPRWITPFEICRILYILLSLEFNNWFIIHSKYFPVLKGVSPFRSLFFCLPKITQSRLQVFFGQRFNNLQQAAPLTSLIQYDEDSFQIWWTAAGCGELCVWF